LDGLSLKWQVLQFVAPAALWLKNAKFQDSELWQAEHCPEKWFVGRSFWWQDWQFVLFTALWSKLTCGQPWVVWQAEHSPE
jgi:hypothetical protein